MMPSCVVEHNNHFLSSFSKYKEPYQKFIKAICIESFRFHSFEFPILNPYGTEYSYILARRSMKDYGVNILRRNPHGATCAMLTEMTFIFTPQANSRIIPHL